jgi:hypothetical protein
MQRKLLPTLILPILLILLLPALPVAADDDNHDHADDHEHGEDHHSPFAGMPLVMLMHNMQYYAHKLGLAIDAGNAELQHFYGHELEEVIEAVGEIEDYDGIAIAAHLDKTLKPAFEALETSLDSGDAAKIDTAYGNLLGACNGCHRSSERPFIVIQRNRDNPYPQDFSPRN